MSHLERAKAITSKYRTAIVHDWLTVMGGAEEVMSVIHKTIDAPIYVGQYNPDKMKWAADATVIPHWINKLPLAKSKHYVYAPILADVYRGFDLRDYDLVITISHTFAHHAKARPEAVHFGYYHTVARSLWTPEIDNRAGNGLIRNMIVNRLKPMDLEAAKNFTYVTSNSKTSGARVEKFYKRPVDNVLYPSVDVNKWLDTPRVSDEEGYVIWSRLIPYKKFDLTIEAAKKHGFKVNIVGAGPQEAELKEIARGHNNVVFHGRLADPDLKQLLSRSRGVIFPAYEDFGIVPVEAMAAGVPVIVYEQGGAAETVLPQFGEQIKAQSVDELTAAVDRLEKKNYDPEALKAHAAKFSVERFQNEIVTFIEEAIERGPNRNFLP